MTIKDILVHLDGSGSDSPALKAAADLAARNGARLKGLFARTEIPASGLVARLPSDVLGELAERCRADLEKVANGARTAFAAMPYRPPTEVLNMALLASYHADLVVIGQHVVTGLTTPADFVEHLILKSGRPVMVVPPRETAGPIGTRVVVGWKPGREAARALHDAMPLIERARSVIVLGIGPPPAGEAHAAMIDHLASHGIAARAEQMVVDGLDIPDTLLSRSYDHEADLLILGAHAGYGLPMLGPGASTRHLLRHAHLPVLFSY